MYLRKILTDGNKDFLKKRGCYYEQKNKKYRSRTL